jgi:hypothetical protein
VIDGMLLALYDMFRLALGHNMRRIGHQSGTLGVATLDPQSLI